MHLNTFNYILLMNIIYNFITLCKYISNTFFGFFQDDMYCLEFECIKDDEDDDDEELNCECGLCNSCENILYFPTSVIFFFTRNLKLKKI